MRRVAPRAPKPPGITAKLRAAKRRRQQREDHDVYELVDLRDGKTSRVSGEYCGDAIHRHHIDHGGTRHTTTDNVISLTPDEHLVMIHQEATLRLSGNADTRNSEGQLCGVLVERRGDDDVWRIEKRC